MSTRDPLAAMEAQLAEMHEAFALTKGKRKDGTRTHIPAPKTERGRQSAQARGYRPPRSGSGDWVHVSVTPRDERLPAPPPPPKAPKPKPAAPSTTGATSIEDLTAHARRDPAWARRALAALTEALGSTGTTPATSPDKVLDEMRRMNPRLGDGGLVSLPDLRQRLGLPKAAFDALVLEMADARHIALHRSDRGASMRPEDRAALVQDDRGHSYNAASLWTTDSERKPASWTGTPTDAQLTDFASAVQAAAERAPADASPLDPRNVLISHVWRQMQRDGTTNGLDEATFKQWLVLASRDRIHAAHADSVHRIDREELKASATTRGTWEFHYVRAPNRPMPPGWR